jgi:hypothetical protein
MTVDLQIRAVQLDSDDQHLVEAPGMPKACQIECRALQDMSACDRRRVAAFRNNSGVRRQQACPDLCLVSFGHSGRSGDNCEAHSASMSRRTRDRRGCLAQIIKNLWPDTCFLPRGAVANRNSTRRACKLTQDLCDRSRAEFQSCHFALAGYD